MGGEEAQDPSSRCTKLETWLILQGKNEFEAEEYFVSALESWRDVLSLKEFFIAGHSLGGFIACVYAMKYPERVKGMLLLEPWGFFDPPDTRMKTVAAFFLTT